MKNSKLFFIAAFFCSNAYSSDNCIHHDQLNYIKNNFTKNLEKPGFLDKYLDDSTQLEVNAKDITTRYLRCAKLSNATHYDISKKDEDPNWVKELKTKMCVRVFKLSMKDSLRRSYIDDGYYGYFFLFENSPAGKVRLKTVSGLVGEDAESGPCH